MLKKLFRPSYIYKFIFFSIIFITLLLIGQLLKRTKPFEVQRQLDPNHPLRIQYESDVKSFNDESTLWLSVYKNEPFTSKEIQIHSESLHQNIIKIPGIIKVITPSNAKYFIHDGNNLNVENFIINGKISEESSRMLQTELWKNNLISENEKSFLIKINLDKTLQVDLEEPLIASINKHLDVFKQKNTGIEAKIVGIKVASAAFLNEMYFQQKVITPLLLLMLIIFYLWLFRSIQIVVWCIFTMFACYVATLCLIIFIEGGLGPYSSFALMFSLIVATTDLIHFFGRYQQLDGSAIERLNKTIFIAKWPCLLTSLTTTAGFLALVINTNQSIRYLGIYCAFACMLEWVIIFYLLPYIFQIFILNPKHKKFKIENLSARYFKILNSFNKHIIVISITSLAIGAYFAFKLNIDDNFYAKFNQQHSLSKTINYFSKTFHFIGSIDVVFKIPNKSLFNQKFLEDMSKIEKEILSHSAVSRVRSLRQVNDLLIRQLKTLNIPESSVEKSRLSTLNLLKAYGEFDDLIDVNTNQIRTVVFLKSFSNNDFENTLSLIYRLQEKYKSSVNLRPGGFAVIRSYINNQVIQDFLESFILGFILIFLCFLLLYRNFKWAFLALVPNALPLLIVAGLIGVLNIPVGTDLVVILCISFGISGDNTIHLSYVLQEYRKNGDDYQLALHKTINLIGMAMLGTSGIFLFSLPVLLIGHLLIFKHIAIFLSISFLLAFISDLFVFPALQIYLKDSVRLNFNKD